jgi:hypothetical protein
MPNPTGHLDVAPNSDIRTRLVASFIKYWQIVANH